MLHQRSFMLLPQSMSALFFRVMILLGTTLLGLSGCASFSFFGNKPDVTQTETVFTGSLGYKAPIALATNSTAVIKLYDGTQPDQLITEEQIPLNGKQVPIDFKLHIAEGLLALNHPYLLQTYLVSENHIEWFSEPMAVTTDKQQLGRIELKPFNDKGVTTEMMCGKTLVTITNHGDTITMQVNEERIVLNPAISASGARYVAKGDPATVFWSKGSTATITLHGHDLPECVERRDQASEKIFKSR